MSPIPPQGLKNTQFEVGMYHMTLTWLPQEQVSGFRFSSLQVNQKLFHGKLKLMAGYRSLATELHGMYTGGNVAGSLLGMGAILPYLVGESSPSNITPALSAHYHFTENFYNDTTVSSSVNPNNIRD